MKHIATAFFWLLLLPSTVLAQAAAADTVAQREAVEHARIRSTRSAEELRFANEEAACYSRFAVNDCLIDVRASKRMLLADLRRQEISLNDAQRKRRAAEQLLRSDEKASSVP